jgi:hypothetical protein
MKTYLRRYLVIFCFSVAAFVFAACATTHESLRTSANRMDDASTRFAAEIRYQGNDSKRDRVSRDAEALAKAAHNLDLALSKGESRANVEDEYRNVSDSYGQLHTQLSEEGYAVQDKRVLEDFDRVTTAYRDLEVGMGHRTADTRY